MSDPIQTTPANSRPRAGMRRLLLGAAFALTFAAGAVTAASTPALALGMTMDSMDSMGGMGGMGGMHGHMHATAEAHIDKMLTAVDATPEQKQKIKAILHKGFESVGPMHKSLGAAHGDLHKVLAAPTIDRAALEQLRMGWVSEFDQTSKVLVQTLADAAEVLSPEQRAKLAAMMAEHNHSHS